MVALRLGIAALATSSSRERPLDSSAAPKQSTHMRKFPVSSTPDIAGHYTRGNLIERLRTALRDDGGDPDRPTLGQLAPYDHFHGRGLEATEELASALLVRSGDHLLDIG